MKSNAYLFTSALLGCLFLTQGPLAHADEDSEEALEAACPASDPACRELIDLAVDASTPVRSRSRATQSRSTPRPAQIHLRLPVTTQRASLPERVDHATVSQGTRGIQLDFDGDLVQGSGPARPGATRHRIQLPRPYVQCLDLHYSPVVNRLRSASTESTLNAAERMELMSAEAATLRCASPQPQIERVYTHSNKMFYLGVESDAWHNPGVDSAATAQFTIGMRYVAPQIWNEFDGGIGGMAHSVAGSGGSEWLPLLRLHANIEYSTPIHNGWTPTFRGGLLGDIVNSTGGGGLALAGGWDHLSRNMLLSVEGARCQFTFETTPTGNDSSHGAYVLACGPAASVSWTPSERTALIARVRAFGGAIQETVDSGDSSFRVILGTEMEANVRFLSRFFAGARIRIDGIINRELGDRASDAAGPRVQGTATTGFIF